MLIDKLRYPLLLLLGQYIYFIIYLCYRNIKIINYYSKLLLESTQNEKKEVFLIFILIRFIKITLLKILKILSNYIIKLNNIIIDYINDHREKNINNLMKYLFFKVLYKIEYLDNYYYNKLYSYIKKIIFENLTNFIMKEVNNNILKIKNN